MYYTIMYFSFRDPGYLAGGNFSRHDFVGVEMGMLKLEEVNPVWRTRYTGAATGTAEFVDEQSTIFNNLKLLILYSMHYGRFHGCGSYYCAAYTLFCAGY